MRRIYVYESDPTALDYAEGCGPETVGYFDADRAPRFDDGVRWDGTNRIGVASGSQWIDEYLYRTAQGRWVRNRDASRYNNGPDLYWYVSEDDARDWLLRSGVNDAAVERFFGPIPEEEGPSVGGRPSLDLDPPFAVRLTAGTTAYIDKRRRAEGISRSEWVRRAVDRYAELPDVEHHQFS